MTKHSSALDPALLRRLEDRSAVDVVVGIPTYKNSRTIGTVITALAEGLQRDFADYSALIVISDGGSTDDTIDIARATRLPMQVSTLIAPYVGTSGKGSSIRAVLEVADILQAKACAIVDADVRSISPEWLKNLLEPVLQDQADYVSPVYTRDRAEATINDLIAYPLTRSLYGRDIRRPLGSEVAMSPLAWKRFLAKDVWETDVARFGIHIWMITMAITSGWRLYQASLGVKSHDYKDSTVGFEPKFMQIVGTMFRLMTIHRRVWPEINTVMPVPIWGDFKELKPDIVPPPRPTFWEGFRKGTKRYRGNLDSILDGDQLEVIDRLLLEDSGSYNSKDWARTVSNFAVVYNRGEGDPDKVALSLLPLYYARKASLLQAAEGHPWNVVEESILEQAESFSNIKPDLVDSWVSYLPWKGSRYY